MIRRSDAEKLLLGLLLAGLAQVLLVRLPPTPQPARRFLEGLRPMWPNTGPAVLAILLFIVGGILFARALHSLLEQRSISFLDSADPDPPRRLIGPSLLAAAAGLLSGALLLKLFRDPTGSSFGWGFFLSWAAIVAACLWSGDRPFGRAFSAIRERGKWWEAAYVVAMTGGFVWLSLFDLRNWYYSVIGDEFVYREASEALVRGRPWVSNIFSQAGVYGYFPALSTYFQSALMRVFGTGLVGWKAAALVPVAASLPVAYLLARALVGRRAAILTLGMLASSHYLLAYDHAGYPNLEPLFPTLVSLLLLIHAVRRGSRTLLVLCGVFAGLGWYTFYSSRAAIVILTAVVVAAVRPGQRLKIGLPVFVGFTMLFLPLLAVNRMEIVRGMLGQSLGSAEKVESRAWLPVWNLGRSLLAFNYNIKSGTYLSGSLAEPLTALLFVFGLALALSRWRDARSRILVLWFAIALLVTGVLSSHDYVTITRLHYVLPVVAILGSMALDWLLQVMERSRPPWNAKGVQAAIVVGVLAAITASNLYRWFVQSPRIAPSTEEAVAIRALEEPRCRNAPRRSLIVTWGIGGAYLKALDARGFTPPPEFALYSQPPTFLDTIGSRCILFPFPRDSEAIALMNAVEKRSPSSRGFQETDWSRETRIRVYYPTQVLGPGAAPSR